MISDPVTRPLLRYYGGKWRLASWIISHFPEHTCFVDCFGGSAAITLRKPQSKFEIYNDLCGDAVNFFRVLRERPRELRRALAYTPYAREEFELSYEPVALGRTGAPPVNEGASPSFVPPSAASTNLERARRFFVMAWQGYGGPRKQRLTGWKNQKRNWESGRADQIAEWNTAKDISTAARRFLHVQIENDDALKVIQRFDTPHTLFYCDPPYPADTRNAKWCKTAYNHELGGADHVHLANLLKKIKGRAIISTYPNTLYDELFAGWTRVEKTCQTMNGTLATELLYISPRAAQSNAR